MKLFLLIAFVVLCSAQGPRKVGIFTDEELVVHKDFIACYNLARFMSMKRYAEIKQKENEFNAQGQEGSYRYMLDVTHKWKRHATQEQKDYLLELFKSGEDYPELPEYSNDIVVDPNNLIKSAEDFKIPDDFAETVNTVQTLGPKFSDSLDRIKVTKRQEEQATQSSVNIMGMNINKIGTTAKVIYALTIIICCLLLLYICFF